MQKISSIIPTSKRVSQVDFKESGALRPGVPSFGRPVGVSTLAEGGYVSTANIGVEPFSPGQRREFEKAKIVNNVSAGFFMHKTLPEAPRSYDQNMKLKNDNTQAQYFSKKAEGIEYRNQEPMLDENASSEQNSSDGAINYEDLNYAYTGEFLDRKV